MNLDQRLQLRVPIPIYLNNGKRQEYHYDLITLQYRYNFLFSMSTMLFCRVTVSGKCNTSKQVHSPS